jgi:hypothetical protein
MPIESPQWAGVIMIASKSISWQNSYWQEDSGTTDAGDRTIQFWWRIFLA